MLSISSAPRASLFPALCLTFGLTLAPTDVRADTLFGIYAGAANWQQELGGGVSSGATDLDVENDLGVRDDASNSFYLAVEHPLPLLPNLRAQYVTMDIAGSNVLSRNVQFSDGNFLVAEQVATNVELTQADAVLYYEVMDNVVSLDIGVAARYVDGFVAVASASDGARADFTGVLPMLYGKTRIDLPLSGFWLGAEAQGLAYEGNQLLDANVQVGWESRLGIGAEFGWRAFSIELEDYDDISVAELDVEGPYLGLNYHF